jgi:hypothetical protein
MQGAFFFHFDLHVHNPGDWKQPQSTSTAQGAPSQRHGLEYWRSQGFHTGIYQRGMPVVLRLMPKFIVVLCLGRFAVATVRTATREMEHCCYIA